MAHHKKIFISGGGGYLGSVMVALLCERGYEIIVFDRFFFGREPLAGCANNPLCSLYEGDSRSISKEMLKDVDTVLDLAALANDAAAELDPEVTYEINWKARVRLAMMAKEMHVRRYILASSCSVYGFQENLLCEDARLSPLTTYAKSTLQAERGVLPLNSRDFTVTILRQGTLYGISPRMRFDLVVNTMTLNMFKEGKIIIRGGDQWRPLLNVEDSARAFLSIMEADHSIISGEVFNVGGSTQNFQISMLAQELATILPHTPEIIHGENGDTRSYRVSCDKIKKSLGWDPLHTVKESAGEIYDGLTSGQLADLPQTRTLEWYKILLKNNPHILKNYTESKKVET